MATIITGDMKDLDGFSVNRILPNRDKKMVGPFIFLDHIGPADFAPGQGVNVRPHPHIGLSTLTYLFSGSMLHRDSLGTVQEIFPGEVNWMTAGRGIVHSERETMEVRDRQHLLDGLQFWVALPPEKAETEPSFEHFRKTELPHYYLERTIMRLIAGEAYGMTAPASTHWPMFFLDVISDHGEVIPPPDRRQECAVYIRQGTLDIGGERFGDGDFVLLESDEEIQVCDYSRFVILGGRPFTEKPYIRWNFVAWSRERIRQAEQDWQQQRFAHIPGDQREFTPLPGTVTQPQ